APFALSSSVWIGVALAAIFGFVAAAFKLVLLYPFVGIAAAAACGALAYYALDQGWTLRAEEQRRGPTQRPLRGRAKEIALAPSLEVYDPRRAEPSDPGGSPPSVE
ncbi:MAG: hypothetical protein L3K08_04810, partial [Thermoplasmata archaeon]|nr:hypothetical protein [Thermoplasmata archaeon]